MCLNVAYEMLKGFIPVRTAAKTRANANMLIVSNEKADLYYLNETAKFIWSMIDGTKSIDEISCVVANEYDAESESVKDDIVKFVRDMQRRKLIRLKEVKKSA